MRPRTNYHSHTARCHHASGTVADYCAAAAGAGLEVLGFSDHLPFPDGRFPETRMTMKEMPLYLAEIDAAREAYPALTILKGFECEWDGALRDYFASLFDKRGVDYLVGAAHWVPVNGAWRSLRRDAGAAELLAYADYLTETIASGLFAYIAHPDAFAAGGIGWNADAERCARDILAAAQETGVPLEINGYGMRKARVAAVDGLRPVYPWPPFWRVAAEYDIAVVCNSDAHRPEDVAANIAEAKLMALEYGLPEADLSRLESIDRTAHEPRR